MFIRIEANCEAGVLILGSLSSPFRFFPLFSGPISPLLSSQILLYQKQSTWSRNSPWTSLVVQWLRICLPTQGTRVQALVHEDPTCCGAAKPTCHNYWDCVLEPVHHNYRALVPQLLKPVCLEPVLRNKRSHHNEKPAHCNEEQPLLAATRESPRALMEDPMQPKINK